MSANFKEVMSKRSDYELIKIITIDRHRYQSLALEAAELEVQNRNIDFARIEELKLKFELQTVKQKQVDGNQVNSLIRFVHFIVDTISLFILIIIVSSVCGLFFPLATEIALSFLTCLIGIIAFFWYYIFMETKYQKTIGKFLTKTKVVIADGTRPKRKDIIRRTFCRLIPFDRFSYLFNSNGFHDRISGTKVIKDNN